DPLQPLDARGHIGVARVEDQVDALERGHDLGGRFLAGRRDVGIGDDTDLHESPLSAKGRLLPGTAIEPREPGLRDTFVIPEELEARALRELLVELPVTD